MEPELIIILFALGLFGGFLSGLLGIGGGIIMVPLLLYVPPVLHAGPLSMKTVAGITSVQSFFGALSGALAHQKERFVSPSLALTLGGGLGAGSLSGSIASKYIASDTILLVFAFMAFCAVLLMFLPKPEGGATIHVEELTFNRKAAVVTGLLIGLFAGIIGQGGAFLFIPAMLYLLRIPTRITIGTALVIGMISSAAVLIGRMGTRQIPYRMAAILVAGVLIGAQAGAKASHKTPKRILRGILAVIIAATAVKIWYELLIT